MKRFDLYLGRRRHSKATLVTHSSVRQFLGEYSWSLPGFTLTSGEGFWRGQHEEAFVLTVVGPPGLEETVRNLGDLYRQRFDQTEVLLTVTDLAVVEAITEPTLEKAA